MAQLYAFRRFTQLFIQSMTIYYRLDRILIFNSGASFTLLLDLDVIQINDLSL